jgi:transposase-like protein
MAWSPEVRAEALALLEDGESYVDVEYHTGVSVYTLREWRRGAEAQAKAAARRQARVDRMRAPQREAKAAARAELVQARAEVQEAQAARARAAAPVPPLVREETKN